MCFVEYLNYENFSSKKKFLRNHSNSYFTEKIKFSITADRDTVVIRL